MLIALYTIFFLGGGGAFGPMDFIDEALDNTKSAIVDDDRRKEATASLKTMKARTKQHTKAIKGLSKEFDSGVSEHDIADEDIDAIWDQFFVLDSEYAGDIVEIRFELRDQVTREEWELLFPASESSD